MLFAYQVVTVLTLDGIPSTPRNLEARQQGSAVKLSWDPPVNISGQLQSYKVKAGAYVFKLTSPHSLFPSLLE